LSRRSRPRGSVLDPSKPASHGCWTPTLMRLSRSSSVCARKDIAAHDGAAGLHLPASAPPSGGLSQAALCSGRVRAGRLGCLRNRRGGQYPVPGFRSSSWCSFSRPMFVELTVSRPMEHFLACHEHGFAALGGVPSKNPGRQSQVGGSAAPSRRRTGVHPRYLDFARHHGFAIEAAMSPAVTRRARRARCGLRQKEFPAWARVDRLQHDPRGRTLWPTPIANVRIHGETQQTTVDLLAQERPRLGPLNPHPYDIAHTSTSVAPANSVSTLDTNQYSVPPICSPPIDGPRLSGPDLHLLRQPAHARHTRAYGVTRLRGSGSRQGLIAQRSRAREQR